MKRKLFDTVYPQIKISLSQFSTKEKTDAFNNEYFLTSI